jgi:putative PEP-CTERM system histidine kinase
MIVLIAANAACAAAFASLAFLVFCRRPGQSALLAGASVVTALWAALSAVDAAMSLSAPADAALTTLDILRTVGWLAVVLSIVRTGRLSQATVGKWRLVVVALTCVGAFTLLADLWLPAGLSAAGERGWVLARLIGHLSLSLAGLVAIENAWRNAPAERIWSVKFLLIGLAAPYCFDFFLYADAVLFVRADSDLFAARPLVAALAAPLIAIALRRGAAEPLALAASHRFVFHSAAILGAGVYLVLMGAAGFYIREFGGSWGPVAQVAFLAMAGILLIAVLASGSFRARARVLIAKHLFAYRYDYREEWLRFIGATARDEGKRNLKLRVIEAIARIVDSPGGTLWLRDDSAHLYAPAAAVNGGNVDAVEAQDGALTRFLERSGWVVDLAELAARPQHYGGLAGPDWLRQAPNAWLVVPLAHRDELLGFLVLQKSRAPRQLNWEDYDLLKTVSRQAAALLAEERAVIALTDAREIDLFNRRFAFVVHDIKTLISQMSLLLSNAERHGHDPEFQREFIPSVRDAVDKMSRMLAQINSRRAKETRRTTVELAALVRGLARQLANAAVPIEIDAPTRNLSVEADEEQVSSIFRHLMQNAVEAARGRVQVRLQPNPRDDGILAEVEDDGPGMDAAFIREQLFRPLASTKRDGYGIGAYQCRELIRELGGQLTVSSHPGGGTIMRVHLPAAVGFVRAGEKAVAVS